MLRAIDANDARGVRLTLTRAGRKLYDGLIRAAADRNDAFLDCLSAKERAAFDEALAKLAGAGARVHRARALGAVKTRITELLGISYPMFQAAMSWASSNAPLVIAVSNAGGMGVIAAGPMRPEDFRRALADIQRRHRQALRRQHPAQQSARAAELLDIAFEAHIPVMVASQGGPREQLARFRAVGTKWLHVVASVEHAKKAEAAGVDALVVDGAEAGGHPPPSEVGTLVLVRRVVKAVKLPVVASGGVADGAGIAALLALGADAVQLGTRFIATPEASVHDNYKRAVLAADVDDSTLVGARRACRSAS